MFYRNTGKNKPDYAASIERAHNNDRFNCECGLDLSIYTQSESQLLLGFPQPSDLYQLNYHTRSIKKHISQTPSRAPT